MKPSSANFRHYLGSDGVRRKEWQVFCKCCDKESWIKSLCKICHKNYHDYEREVKKNG